MAPIYCTTRRALISWTKKACSPTFLKRRITSGCASTRNAPCYVKIRQTPRAGRSNQKPSFPSTSRCSQKATRRTSSRSPVVFLEHLLELIMGQSDDRVAVDAGHGLGAHHGVYDGFLSRFDGGGEQRADALIGHGVDRVGAGRCVSVRIGRGEGQENIARAIAESRTRACQPQCGTAGQALELMRQQRRVGSHNDNDGSDVSL